MKMNLRSAALPALFLTVFAGSGLCQGVTGSMRTKVDAVVLDAYKAASAAFPCKIKTGGKPRMLRWQNVDKCLNESFLLVDWQSVSRNLRGIRLESDVEAPDFLSVVEASFGAQALMYERIFLVKEAEALLPLSNSVLRFLPADSLANLPVFAKSGTKVGLFAGIYTFEKMGSLSGTKQNHYLFQYTDQDGNIQSSTDRLLLDSFGIPWKEAKSHRGFRLPADKLDL
jgi:hypothetical protein